MENTDESGRNIAIAGRVCSIVGIVIGVIFVLFIVLGLITYSVFVGQPL
jgi:hypothetical protein